MRIDKYRVVWVLTITYGIAFLLKFTLDDEDYLPMKQIINALKLVCVIGLGLLALLWKKLD